MDGLGTAGGFKFIIEDRGEPGLERSCNRRPTWWSTKGNDTPGLQGLFTSLRANTPWMYLDIDRDQGHGARGGESTTSSRRLQVYLGSYYVNNFNEFGRSWQVNVHGRRATSATTSTDI